MPGIVSMSGAQSVTQNVAGVSAGEGGALGVRSAPARAPSNIAVRAPTEGAAGGGARGFDQDREQTRDADLTDRRRAADPRTGDVVSFSRAATERGGATGTRGFAALVERARTGSGTVSRAGRSAPIAEQAAREDAARPRSPDTSSPTLRTDDGLYSPPVSILAAQRRRPIPNQADAEAADARPQRTTADALERGALLRESGPDRLVAREREAQLRAASAEPLVAREAPREPSREQSSQPSAQRETSEVAPATPGALERASAERQRAERERRRSSEEVSAEREAEADRRQRVERRTQEERARSAERRQDAEEAAESSAAQQERAQQAKVLEEQRAEAQDGARQRERLRADLRAASERRREALEQRLAEQAERRERLQAEVSERVSIEGRTDAA